MHVKISDMHATGTCALHATCSDHNVGQFSTYMYIHIYHGLLAPRINLSGPTGSGPTYVCPSAQLSYNYLAGKPQLFSTLSIGGLELEIWVMIQFLSQ
jgi:hypothetical protein